MPAASDNRIQLVGAWRTLDQRKLDVAIRVTSRRVTGPYSRIETTAEYHIGRSPVDTDTEALAIWAFHKTLPDEKDYRVILHKDGKLTCDCPHNTYAKAEDMPALCVHQSCVLTLADAFKELVTPLPAAS